MTTIFLSIHDERRREAFASALAGVTTEVISAAESSPNGLRVDVIVSDRMIDTNRDAAAEQSPARNRVAVAAIGWNGPADVVLPGDATPREVALACSLLSEIVRLRREGWDSHDERAEMRQLAYSDPLTGIPNRRAWDHEMGRQFERAACNNRSLGLALVDLDNFKNVNDQYGHAAGDEVLKEAARAISASVRGSDFIARMGGDEFGLLLPEVDLGAVSSVVERIRRAIATRCSRPVGPNISASVGYSILRENDKFTTLFERADAALRDAKRLGRDRAVGL